MDRNAGIAPYMENAVVVALRKESVDRNLDPYGATLTPNMSLSARRAWIEIRCDVAVADQLDGRSPQGERG